MSTLKEEFENFKLNPETAKNIRESLTWFENTGMITKLYSLVKTLGVDEVIDNNEQLQSRKLTKSKHKARMYSCPDDWGIGQVYIYQIDQELKIFFNKQSIFESSTLPKQKKHLIHFIDHTKTDELNLLFEKINEQEKILDKEKKARAKEFRDRINKNKQAET